MNCNIQKKKGKILGQFTLNAYSDEPELPDISPDDAGKFLGINTQGEIKPTVVTVPPGTKIYRHSMAVTKTNSVQFRFIIYSTSSTPMDTAIKFNDFLAANVISSYRLALSTVSLTKKTGVNGVIVLSGVRNNPNGNEPRWRWTEITFNVESDTITATYTDKNDQSLAGAFYEDMVVEI